jgi:hypothetical protein
MSILSGSGPSRRKKLSLDEFTRGKEMILREFDDELAKRFTLRADPPLSHFWGKRDPRGGGQPLTMDDYNPFED